MMSEQEFDSLFAEAELAAGLPPALVAARNPLAVVSATFVVRSIRPPRWTTQEDRFLQENLGVLTLEEIAARLGRSVNGVKIRQVRQQFAAPSKRPGWLTGHQVARILGVDIHPVCALAGRSLIPLRRLPGERGILTISKVTLYRWATNPEHWPYFIRSVWDPARITDPRLRRLIERQKERWGDEWWSIGQVAAYHRVGHTDVNRLIRQGKIAATDWGNWWIKRSEATRPGLKFWKGKGARMAAYQEGRWSPRADAYLLQARAEGLAWAEIGRRMKRKENSVRHRGYKLLKVKEL